MVELEILPKQTDITLWRVCGSELRYGSPGVMFLFVSTPYIYAVICLTA
jgi:hypothetical protein